MIIKKYKNTSGASIFIALIFLLLCALVGSVVLTAASASSGRLVNLKKNEQSYYTVLSAAKLLKNEIIHSRVEITSENNEILSYKDNTPPEKKMTEFLQEAIEQVFKSKKQDGNEREDGEEHEDEFKPVYSDTWTIQSSEKVIKDVTAVFSMDKEYNIEIMLSEGNRRCELSIPAVMSEREEEIVINNGELKETATRKVINLTWLEGEIQKK